MMKKSVDFESLKELLKIGIIGVHSIDTREIEPYPSFSDAYIYKK